MTAYPTHRTILHCDLNSYFASVETMRNPALRSVPMIVGGETEDRHGIVLAKNELAKKAGITTGETIWQAKTKCPDLVVVPPQYDDYVFYSRAVRQIYSDYTDQIESMGIDECWLDVSASRDLFGDGRTIADTLRGNRTDHLCRRVVQQGVRQARLRYEKAGRRDGDPVRTLP